MNIKAGELCVVLAPREGGTCEFTDHFVETVALYTGPYMLPDGAVWTLDYLQPGDRVWIVKGAGIRHKVENIDTGQIVEIGFCEMWEHRLRPIRDPGDEAKDETLMRIPTPYLERA